MSALLDLQCETCGRRIKRYRSAVKQRVYCSKECSDASKTKALPSTCANCGKNFLVTPSKMRSGRGVYCSQRCKGTSREVSCKTCGKVFRLGSREIKEGGNYCSRHCHYKAHGRAPITNGDGTVSIPLTRGHIATIDEDDLHLIAGISWQAWPHRRTVYARGLVNGESKLIHQVIAKTPPGLVTDHIDGNGLNNRRSNLRSVTNSENLRNSYKHRERKAS